MSRLVWLSNMCLRLPFRSRQCFTRRSGGSSGVLYHNGFAGRSHEWEIMELRHLVRISCAAMLIRQTTHTESL